MHDIFPWCLEVWNNLISSFQQNRFPHAILFFGNNGLGKSELALHLSQYLLCSDLNKNDTQTFCGVCKDCVLFLAKTHGDFYEIAPEDGSKSIGVDQIRNLKAAAHQKPQRNKIKFFVMARADKMTVAASNALLKVLEEPPGESVFILTSERKHFLSATVLSRCQQYGFCEPDLEKAEQWLLSTTEHAFSREAIKEALSWSLGSPLLALQLLKNNMVIEYQSYAKPLLEFFSEKSSLYTLSKSWQGKSLADIIFVIQITCYYLLKREWTGNYNKKIVYRWSSKVIEIKKMLSSGIALNEALMLDLLLAD